ncbi:phosphatidate phosphatase LPIN3 isoform X3 [Drosophila hydei]|uniref:Phosphatidate phosphatase LPIN3 isoform X3 n=1 Tax=Drosophila hydei TaxID=7224 RepID=A0A6J1M7I1_DROHY|nr:phosphatidate phosphatase LPIN3 isoform X3 [Drosophila hydei]
MNSLVRVFSNLQDFYNDINAATLTGAIDVIAVEQPDGEFLCSPFHVRFGKLGVLRSREKVVDIEINGVPVDIQMKLGDSGEAFFVEECLEDDDDELPANLATSPIPKSFLQSLNNKSIDILEDMRTVDKSASDDLQIPLPIPRRNSIDLSKEEPKEIAVEGSNKFENQASDYTHRRHTDNTLERRKLSESLKEYTTRKMREEWAEHEELFQEKKQPEKLEKMPDTKAELEARTNVESQPESIVKPQASSQPEEKLAQTPPSAKPEVLITTPTSTIAEAATTISNDTNKDDAKNKTKKRRKKSQMKKKNSQRKTSSSSSAGSAAGGDMANADANSINSMLASNIDETDVVALKSVSKTTTNSSSNDEQASAALLTAHTGNDSPLSELNHAATPTSSMRHDLDIHFFSDTEITTPTGIGAVGAGRNAGRPSTPIQSDSELETTMRDKRHVGDDENSALWKWGELPTPEQTKGTVSAADAQQNERHWMISNMFSFMRRANRLRKEGATEAGDIYLSDLEVGSMDPEMAALYFPSPKPKETDRESGNGTSLPHSPSSLEENHKSLDSDFDETNNKQHAPHGKKYLDFVAMSMCGMQENGAPPKDDDFDRQLVSYADDAIEQLISPSTQAADDDKPEASHQTEHPGQTKRSWWNWRRSQDAAPNQAKIHKNGPMSKDEKDGDQAAVSTQTSRPNSPDLSDPTLSKSDSLVNAENTSTQVDNLEELTMGSSKSDESKERYKKTLRLSSSAIKKLNLKDGMNEIEFSVTTAYQGTTRCKCYLFRWKHNDKVVISDIDGTITKSDVLGHILPMVGKDWAQLGVAQLFSKIEQNGYKLLYLSARAIGQSRVTREYLRSIRQGNVMLPDGPLLLNPTSLISAFHREVIEKKPEQFKIACLSDIRDLFPKKDPFYAGYGNRINDVWAYRAVGIPIMRIFTINTKGELKHELTQTFQSSGYINQSLEVDEYFPLLMQHDEYEYRTDTFEDEDLPDEIQFSTDNSDIDDDSDDIDNDDDDDDEINVDNDDDDQDMSLIMAGRHGAKNEILLASPPKWLN